MALPPGFTVRPGTGGQVSHDPLPRKGLFFGIGFHPAALRGPVTGAENGAVPRAVGTALAFETVGYQDFSAQTRITSEADDDQERRTKHHVGR